MRCRVRRWPASPWWRWGYGGDGQRAGALAVLAALAAAFDLAGAVARDSMPSEAAAQVAGWSLGRINGFEAILNPGLCPIGPVIR